MSNISSQVGPRLRRWLWALRPAAPEQGSLLDTADSVALNDAVRDYPHPSARYREVFNSVARSMGYEFQWVSDDKNPNAIEPAELQLTPIASEFYGTTGPTPTTLKGKLGTHVKLVFKEIERRRLEIVAPSASMQRMSYRAPVEHLSSVERKAVSLFDTQVKPIINRIEGRQHDPFADQLKSWVDRHGDRYASQLFVHVHRDGPIGPHGGNPSFSLVPFYPEQPPINGMIDGSISLDEFRELTRKFPSRSETLRPTTVLVRGAQGAIEVTPLPLHPGFRQDHLQLASALEGIATLTDGGQRLDSKIVDQLSAWSRFFRSGSAADEKAAVQATIDAGESPSLLRVHIGPSESYWPDNTKFPYLLQVGVRDPELIKTLTSWAPDFQTIEKSLEDIPHYAPRPLSSRGGFADPMYQAVTAGFIESQFDGQADGNNFPNHPYGTEGSNRFLLLEHYPAYGLPITNVSRYATDLDVQTPDEITYNYTLFVAGHESGHLLGPQRSHVTPSGETMGSVFGEHWGSADEPKADLTAIEMAALRFRAGKMSAAERKSFLNTYVAALLWGTLSKSQFAAGITDHVFGRTLQVGHYFKTGALTVGPSGRIHVDLERVEASARELWHRIISFQASGDRDGYLRFSHETVSHIPDQADDRILQARSQAGTLPCLDRYV